MGPELMNEFRAQAERFGTEILNVWIDRVDLSERPFTLYAKESQDSEEITTIIKAETLIISTGASAKWLGVPGEEPAPVGLGGNGVSACATCDGFFFRGKEVVIVGGGDTAMEEAMFLTRFASKVTLMHRRDAFRASKIMQERVFANEKIEIMWNTGIKEIVGSKEAGVTGVKIFNTQSNEESEFPTQGVFVAIGHKPNTDLFVDCWKWTKRLFENRRTHDENQHSRRFRLRRCARPLLSPGNHGSRSGCMAGD
jgi:thioredoxin reductase (NADPH)